MTQEDKSLDVLGIKPLASTIEKSTDGALNFLNLICKPAAEEFGLILRDRVKVWRLNNINKILDKAKGKFEVINGDLELAASPRIVHEIIDNASWNDNDEIQELWAGLLVSSCTEDGKNDDNLIFINLLKQLTILEAKILQYSCENASKCVKQGLIGIDVPLKINRENLENITKLTDINQLDRELDHMRSLSILHPLNGGFSMNSEPLIANITPSALALNLYVRCQGHNKSPIEYWNLQPE